MNPGTVRYLLVFVFVIVQFSGNECGRSRPSPSRPRPSPTYRPFPRPSPTFRPFPRPSPTFRPFPQPAPTFRPFPRPSPTFRPFPQPSPTHRPFPQPSPTHRPFPQPSPTYRPFPQPSPTYRPFPQPSPTYRPFPQPSPTYRPFPNPSPTYRPYPNQPTYRPNYGTTRYPNYQPTKYPTQPSRYPVGPNPSYPGYRGGGVFSPGRPFQPSYQIPVRVPSPSGSRIKVYNINNYHSPGYFAPPSYPVYRYTYRDTGNSALGFYLGYSLGRISHPTYYHSHYSYDGYSPRYDHYTVHHYYHNTGNIPKQQTVTTKVIIQCGDGSQICPANTTALCTANGQIMCVVVASNTVSCKDNPNLRCVESRVPCENNEAPECKGVAKGQSTSIYIPCISNTVIEGNITTVNNTIISTDPVKNSTTVPLKSLMSSTNTSSNITTTTLQPPVGVTTLQTIATTMSNETFPSIGANTRAKRAAPQYCVTILAEPSKRAPTEGEQVFSEVTNVFENFFSKAFGMDKLRANISSQNYIPRFGD